MEYRLNKYISTSGYCSRREADRFIEEGKVTVNGKKATFGMRVLPGQKVKVNGELIVNKIEPIYIAFNKPVGIVSTTDPQEKSNIVKYISHEQRIFPIGRLDKDSQGLILLTNDGDIVNKILRVGNNHRKEYIVTVDKPITKDFLTRMAEGVPILDRVTRRCEIEQINPFVFRIALIQGLNRQIRRMCDYFDYNVLKLERVQIMNIKLGNLGQGNWRDLTPSELEGLFDLLERSDKEEQGKGPNNSNKAMNRALAEFDIKTDYRKASIAAKYKKNDTPHYANFNDPDEEINDQERALRKGKTATGARSGKPTSGTRSGKPVAPGSRTKTNHKPFRKDRTGQTQDLTDYPNPKDKSSRSAKQNDGRSAKSTRSTKPKEGQGPKSSRSAKPKEGQYSKSHSKPGGGRNQAPKRFSSSKPRGK